MTSRYTLFFSRLAQERYDQIIRFDRSLGEQIAKALDRLAVRPELGKPLKGEWKGYWKYRTGRYRIVYRIERARLLIYVLTIADRKEVYRR